MSRCMELAAWRITESTWLSRSSADRLASADGAELFDKVSSQKINIHQRYKKKVFSVKSMYGEIHVLGIM